jgi:hypothetical protein
MKIGIVGTQSGYSAVCLSPYKGDFELLTPVPLSEDMLLQLRAQILQRLAEYCSKFTIWEGQLLIAIPWAIWSILCLAVCSLWKLGMQFVLLYMWIRFLFFADGIWALSKILVHFKGLRDTQQIKESAAKAKWIFSPTKMPSRAEIVVGETEREYIQRAIEEYPQTAPFYEEMLRKQPPEIFDRYPLGPLGILKMFLTVPRIRRPILIFDLGRLQ